MTAKVRLDVAPSMLRYKCSSHLSALTGAAASTRAQALQVHALVPRFLQATIFSTGNSADSYVHAEYLGLGLKTCLLLAVHTAVLSILLFVLCVVGDGAPGGQLSESPPALGPN